MLAESSEKNRQSGPGGGSVCSEKHAGFLASPLRRLIHNPEKILGSMIQEGDTVVDLGCGPGFFTLAMAKLAGEKGRVIAVDFQQGMLDRLQRRSQGKPLGSRITLLRCETATIGIDDKVDFVLGFYVVHEAPDVEGFLRQVFDILKPGGSFLLVEPRLHVSYANWQRTVEIAVESGMKAIAQPKIALSRAVLFERSQ